jgi:GH15 family glucan-1,4-alpha-glucosidase
MSRQGTTKLPLAWEEWQTFVQSRGSRATDAAALIMPIVKFTSPLDPRWRATMAAITADLVDDTLVHRYQGDPLLEGLHGSEGTFSLCTFWYVQALTQAGHLQQARLCFEKTLGYANHLGLLSEEIGPMGEQLGNFPQALTHLALIGAAFNLDRRLSAAGHRG